MRTSQPIGVRTSKSKRDAEGSTIGQREPPPSLSSDGREPQVDWSGRAEGTGPRPELKIPLPTSGGIVPMLEGNRREAVINSTIDKIVSGFGNRSRSGELF